MHFTLGVDETQPAPIFVRVIDPTDIQNVASEMARIIKDYFPGVDMLNTDLWHLIGAYTYSGPIMDFLQRLIALQREWKQSLTKSTQDQFKAALQSRHQYSDMDISFYIRAYLQALQGGSVPQSIQQPWNYQPSSAATDVGKVAAESLKSVWPYLFGAVAIYGLVTAFLPNLIGSLSRSR